MADCGGKLHIARGQVRATLGSAHANPYTWRNKPLEPRTMLKDCFLTAGDTLAMPPGARVVPESMALEHDSAAAFDWHLMPPSAKIRSASHEEMLLATGELGNALSQVRRALRRLADAVLVSPRHAHRLNVYL